MKKTITFAPSLVIDHAEVAQLVEHQLPKLRVAGSSPVFRSLKYQVVVERLLPDFCFLGMLILHEIMGLKSTKKSTEKFYECNNQRGVLQVENFSKWRISFDGENS